MQSKTVMLAAGGTGGHLFPAFALAEELGRRGYEVDLITDMRGDRYGSDFPARVIHKVPAATPGSKKSPIALAAASATLLKGFLAARTVLKDVRPAALVGFGGYPTIPPLIAAQRLGIPVAIHEQNAVLGRANRLLARRATAIATSFSNVRRVEGALAEKARFTGNPVRDMVLRAAQIPYQSWAGAGDFRLLVFGGSQGARFFTEVIPAALALLPETIRARITLVLQAREEDVDQATRQLQSVGVWANISSFFKDLPEAIAHSHLVVARAGASTVAELAVIGRPSILVPLPHSLDSDQLQNATNLAESGGSWCIEQHELTPFRLAEEIERVVNDPTLLASAAHAAKAQGVPSAVTNLADLVADMIGRSEAAT